MERRRQPRQLRRRGAGTSRRRRWSWRRGRMSPSPATPPDPSPATSSPSAPGASGCAGAAPPALPALPLHHTRPPPHAPLLMGSLNMPLLRREPSCLEGQPPCAVMALVCCMARLVSQLTAWGRRRVGWVPRTAAGDRAEARDGDLHRAVPVHRLRERQRLPHREGGAPEPPPLQSPPPWSAPGSARMLQSGAHDRPRLLTRSVACRGALRRGRIMLQPVRRWPQSISSTAPIDFKHGPN